MRLAQNTGNCQNITAKILNVLGDISRRLIKINQKKKKKKKKMEMWKNWFCCLKVVYKNKISHLLKIVFASVFCKTLLACSNYVEYGFK